MPQRLQREIEKLKQKILTLSTAVEESIFLAIKSLEKRNAALTRKVIEGDFEIDQMEVDLEEDCLKILALYQPVAVDLRFIIAALKINNDLERIGDLAVNIAERAIFLSTHEKINIPSDFPRMTAKVQEMLKKSLDAFVKMDSGLAYEVFADDDEVDSVNREMYRKVEDGIRQHPEHLESLINFLGVSRYLERIADHATNIAEDIIYTIEGKIIRHRVDNHKSTSDKSNPSRQRCP
jgi:phosphate transport system protein